MKEVSIIIPVYNEGSVIYGVIQEILNFNFSFSYEIIIINDGSTDASLAEIKKYENTGNIKIFSYKYNRGYGASLKTGIAKAEGKYVVTYDGDGQFFPEDIERFYADCVQNDYDAVIGEREKLYSGSPYWRSFGKFFIKMIIYFSLGKKLKDFNCGLRMMKKDVITKYLHLCSDKFSFSTTSTMVLINRGYYLEFLPINVRSRKNGNSAVKLASGLSTIYLILKIAMLFNPLKIFFPFGLIFAAFGAFWGANYFFIGHGLSIGALLFLIVGILLIFLGLIADQISEIRKSQFED